MVQSETAETEIEIAQTEAETAQKHPKLVPEVAHSVPEHEKTAQNRVQYRVETTGATVAPSTSLHP
jgi:hypothetical protein